MTVALDTKQLSLQAGGTVVPGRAVYIARPEDEELYRLLKGGEYVNVLSSRQVGKSSLMVQAALRLQGEGWRFAVVDLTSLGSAADAAGYFRGLVKELAARLRLRFDPIAFWAEATGETASQRLIRFFREVVLGGIDGPVAIFLDEIDSTLKLPYTDDLFTALRAIHNERTLDEGWRRLCFCLVGVATPNELIKDRRTTPYNVGRTIWVGDFDPARDDLGPLAAALHDDPAAAKPILARVLYWTDGHPFLTLRLVKDLREAGASSPDSADRYVADSYASLQRLGEDTHIQSILRFVAERLTDSGATLRLYERILKGHPEPDQPTLAHTELKLSGLVKRDRNGRLVLRNRIYARLFDLAWVRATKPLREARRYRIAASAAALGLLLTIGGGSAYLTFYVDPKVSELQTAVNAREALQRLNVGLGQEGSALSVNFPNKAPQAVLAQAVPLLQILLQEPGAPTVLSIYLSDTTIADLTPLVGLSGLQELFVYRTQVSDFSPLAGLSGLRLLSALRTQVSDLSPLAGLSGPQLLYVPGTQVSNLSPLAGLSGLQLLNVSDTQVRDLTPLAGLSVLQKLDVSGTQVSDLSPLAGLKALERLDITGTGVRDTSPVADIPGLRIEKF